MIRFAVLTSFLSCLMVLFPAGRAVYAADDISECRPVARLFSAEICAEALEQELPVEAVMAETGVPAPAESSENDAARAVTLRALIWDKAIAEKYGTSSVASTEAEIKAFQKQLNAITVERYETDKKSAALLRRYLENNEYDALNRAKIEQLLKSIDISILFYEKQQEHESAIPAHLNFISGEAEKKLVTQILQRWKENKVLFEDYGGRLAEVSGRLIPLDAYRMFYEYIVEEGGLKIEDDRFINLFADLKWEKGYKYLPESDPLYKNYFIDPSWQFRMADSRDRLVILENWLRSLPISEGSE